jgi:hypothetical protein
MFSIEVIILFSSNEFALAGSVSGPVEDGGQERRTTLDSSSRGSKESRLGLKG